MLRNNQTANYKRPHLKLGHITHSSLQSYHFQICGMAEAPCNPGYPSLYKYGRAIQFWGAVVSRRHVLQCNRGFNPVNNDCIQPPCDLNDTSTMCYDPIRNETSCCTAECQARITISVFTICIAIREIGGNDRFSIVPYLCASDARCWESALQYISSLIKIIPRRVASK